MLTPSDKKWIGKEIRKEVQAESKILSQEINGLREEMYAIRDELKADILSFKDAILTEIKAMREELSVVIGYRQHLEHHDQRIVKLETHLGISS